MMEELTPSQLTLYANGDGTVTPVIMSMLCYIGPLTSQLVREVKSETYAPAEVKEHQDVKCFWEEESRSHKQPEQTKKSPWSIPGKKIGTSVISLRCKDILYQQQVSLKQDPGHWCNLRVSQHLDYRLVRCQLRTQADHCPDF